MKGIAAVTMFYITLIPTMFLAAKTHDIAKGTYTKPSKSFIRLCIVLIVLDWVAIIFPFIGSGHG